MAERARLGWVIVYVPDVGEAIGFYERAFGLERTFIDPSGTFGQLATGDTALAFAHESLAVGNFPAGAAPGGGRPAVQRGAGDGVRRSRRRIRARRRRRLRAAQRARAAVARSGGRVGPRSLGDAHRGVLAGRLTGGIAGIAAGAATL